MSCAEYQEMLALHISGDLPGHQARRLEAHLQTCDECRALEAKLREGRQALIALAAAEVAPASVRGEVLERIADERRRLAWFPDWKLAGAAVAALLLLALVLAQLIPGPETTPLSADAGPVIPAPVPEAPVPEAPVTEPVAEPVPEPVALAAPEPAAMIAESPMPAKHPQQPAAPRGPEPEATTAPPESVTVKMLTDDPDIVIYMLVNGEEGDTKDA